MGLKAYFYDPNDIEAPVYPFLELIKRQFYSNEDELRFICFSDGSKMNEGHRGVLIPFRDVKAHKPILVNCGQAEHRNIYAFRA